MKARQIKHFALWIYLAKSEPKVKKNAFIINKRF